MLLFLYPAFKFLAFLRYVFSPGRGAEVSTNNAIDALSPLQSDGTGPLIGLGIDRLQLLRAGQVINKRQITDEVQLIGTTLDDRMDWIVGYFYLKEEPNGAQGSWFNQFQLYSSSTGYALSSPSTGTAHTTSNSRSVFGQMGLDLSDLGLEGLKFNFGYRYTGDKFTSCGYNAAGSTSANDADFGTLSECKDNASVLSVKGNAPTWTAGFDYQVTEISSSATSLYG